MENKGRKRGRPPHNLPRLPGEPIRYGKKRAQYFSRTAPQSDWVNGMKGFIITCAPGNEARCVFEVYCALNESFDRLYGSESQKNSSEATIQVSPPTSKVQPEIVEQEEETEDLCDQLAKELTSLKGKKEKGERSGANFYSIITGVSGLLIFRIHEKVNFVSPSEMVKDILENIIETKYSSMKFALRIFPLEVMCHANLEDLKKFAPQVLSKFFHNPEDDRRIKFAIEVHRRHCNHVDKTEYIRTLASLVGKKHCVSLDHPEYTIVIEVIRNRMGIGVMRNYRDYFRNNIRSVLGSVNGSLVLPLRQHPDTSSQSPS